MNAVHSFVWSTDQIMSVRSFLFLVRVTFPDSGWWLIIIFFAVLTVENDDDTLYQSQDRKVKCIHTLYKVLNLLRNDYLATGTVLVLVDYHHGIEKQ